MALTNNGTIRATLSTALIIDPSASGGAINNGTLNANGGVLLLQDGVFTNNATDQRGDGFAGSTERRDHHRRLIEYGGHRRHSQHRHRVVAKPD